MSRWCDMFSWRHHKSWLIILAIYNTFSRSSSRFITKKTKRPYIWHGSNSECVLDLASKWIPQARVCFRLPEPRKAFSAFTGACVCFCVFIYFVRGGFFSTVFSFCCVDCHTEIVIILTCLSYRILDGRRKKAVNLQCWYQPLSTKQVAHIHLH